MRMRSYGLHNLDRMPYLDRLNQDQIHALGVVGQVLPFRVNQYVLDELIDWTRVPDDPLFRLTFLDRQMLTAEDFTRVENAWRTGDRTILRATVDDLRAALNPHPGGQQTANAVRLADELVSGLQHKYRETCLVFPPQGQTCFSYCTFCFRWPQFIGDNQLRIATRGHRSHLDYIAAHPEISDVLVTGGDPLIMKTSVLEQHLVPLTTINHVRTIRVGTKALSFWPHRFLDDDGDALMRLMERLTSAGKTVAIMAHLNHPRELQTDAVRTALTRLRNTGVGLWAQAPLLRHVNDTPTVWRDMWTLQVSLGITPYYMFMERDTGAHEYFAIPIAQAVDIFREAYSSVSGLARTVRGPVMSAWPGKVLVNGIADLSGERAFVMSFIQARDPDRIAKPFFAKWDPTATWFTDLQPASGADHFFLE